MEEATPIIIITITKSDLADTHTNTGTQTKSNTSIYIDIKY